MNLETRVGIPMSGEILENYIKSLINRFFKILPLKEANEETLPVYLESLQSELLGCKEFVLSIHDDEGFLSLIAILQRLIDQPERSVQVVKREVFRGISICNKLKAKYAVAEEA